MVEFLKDWVGYRAGVTVAAAVLGGGVVDVLAKRGIVRHVAPEPQAATVPPAPAVAKPKAASKPKAAKARR